MGKVFKKWWWWGGGMIFFKGCILISRCDGKGFQKVVKKKIKVGWVGRVGVGGGGVFFWEGYLHIRV